MGRPKRMTQFYKTLVSVFWPVKLLSASWRVGGYGVDKESEIVGIFMKGVEGNADSLTWLCEKIYS